ncbi:hypothetical protein GCM10010368_48560 [Streptomyces roseiscleroticus]|uniref:Uncharacterized protein n=1 Tax=Streptomyces roseiscleroticus TaxID=1972 RepID=A0ABN3EVU7_9ACTN
MSRAISAFPHPLDWRTKVSGCIANDSPVTSCLPSTLIDGWEITRADVRWKALGVERNPLETFPRRPRTASLIITSRSAGDLDDQDLVESQAPSQRARFRTARPSA